MQYNCVPGVEVGPGVEVLEGHALLGRVLVVLAHCSIYVFITFICLYKHYYRFVSYRKMRKNLKEICKFGLTQPVQTLMLFSTKCFLSR